MSKLNEWIRWLDARRDWAFDLIRFYLGIGLFVKGCLFASNPDLLPSLLDDVQGFDMWATALAHYAIGAHLAGGFLLAIGLVTRVAAIVQIPLLFGAAFFVHLEEGLFTRQQNVEFTLLVLFLLVLCALHGGGRWSVDYYMSEREELPATAPVR